MTDSPKPPGPMGGTCPECGRYWNARGCSPGNCKSTPEPVVIAGGGTGPAPMEYCKACRAIMERAAEIAVPFNLGDLCGRCQTIVRNAEASQPKPRWLSQLAVDMFRGPLMTAAEIEIGERFAPRGKTGGKHGPGFWAVASKTVPLTHFAGIPVEEFCATDRERMQKMAREGKVGIAGMCASCSAKVDAATPVAPAADSPPPWEWSGEDHQYLADANENNVLWVDDAGSMAGHEFVIGIASPRVRTLVELAPNLERLREIEWSGTDAYDADAKECCPVRTCSVYEGEPHHPDCWLGNTLARLDAAKAGA